MSNEIMVPMAIEEIKEEISMIIFKARDQYKLSPYLIDGILSAIQIDMKNAEQAQMQQIFKTLQKEAPES